MSVREWAGLIALLATAAVLLPAAASAAEEHVLDTTLSLRGDCATSAEDPIPDPGPCPGVLGVDHPEEFINVACGVATDPRGYIYVAVPDYPLSGPGAEGRIFVFDPSGHFLVETKDEHNPCQLAVDSAGNVYVLEIDSSSETGSKAALFAPDSYPPTAETTYLRSVVREGPALGAWAEGVAVDPSNDRLYVAAESRIAEYESAAGGSGLIREDIGLGLSNSLNSGIDVWGRNHDVYVSGVKLHENPLEAKNSRVFVIDGADGHLKDEVGSFRFVAGVANLAVDQSSGDFYVADGTQQNGYVLRQFDAAGEEIGELGNPPALKQWLQADVAVDDPCRDALGGSCDLVPHVSPNEGYVFATAGTSPSSSHLWAFKPRLVGPPEVVAQRAQRVGETEALLRAEVNPHSLSTAYHFEYLTEAAYFANGQSFAGPEPARSVPLPDGHMAAGGSFEAVFVSLEGLAPGTPYRFRLVATNCGDSEAEPGECLTLGEGTPGGEGEDARFATYAAPPIERACKNEALRTGPSAALPDCRAYELVTPPSTNGLYPGMSNFGQTLTAGGFATDLTTIGGDGVTFGVEGGSLPDFEGGGRHDSYEATRGVDGWSTRFAGVPGTLAREFERGGVSLDHGYSFWLGSDVRGAPGPLFCPGDAHGALYLRRPSGAPSAGCSYEPEGRNQFELVGAGSLGVDPFGRGRLIAPGGRHVIFTSNKRLEPQAPANPGSGPETFTGSPVAAVYDRTLDGATHVVSLLPGDLTPPLNSVTYYAGASADGDAVAFTVDSTTYVRLDDAVTKEVTSEEAVFGGLSEDGGKLFYLVPNPGEPKLAGTKIPQGEIFCFDTASGLTTPLGSGGEAVLVNVSADGSHAYFTSPEQLDGAKGEAGKPNLYLWDGSTVRFIATLAPLDVRGAESEGGNVLESGLGFLITRVIPAAGSQSGPGADPSRSTPDGAAFLFESRADLTPYASEGRREIYRYDAKDESLACVSCNPTGAPPLSDAQLQPYAGNGVNDLFPPVTGLVRIDNLSADGRMAFFQSADRLVDGDLDGHVDVYEWEASGTGGCGRPAGCLSLVSGGEGGGDDYLYAVTPDGHDVFFQSGDLLVSSDRDPTPSIYDARIGGGFPPVPARSGECLGEACQPVVEAPDPRTPASAIFRGSDRIAAGPRCRAFGDRLRRATRRARSLRRRARSLRRIAARAPAAPHRARLSRRRAHRFAISARRLDRSAHRLSKRANRCRRVDRRRSQ